MTGDAIEILLKHNRWATRLVLERCALIALPEFHKKYDIGPGTLHNTTTHIVAAMRRWADRISDRSVRPSIDKAPHATNRTPQELLLFLDDAADDLDAVVMAITSSKRLGEQFVVTLAASAGGSQEFKITRGAAIVHVLTHGMHHRAQCLNMLKRLHTKTPLPEIDVIEWQIVNEMHV